MGAAFGAAGAMLSLPRNGLRLVTAYRLLTAVLSRASSGSGRAFSHWDGAEGAAPSRDGDLAQALRTALGGGVGRGFAAVHARNHRVHGHHHEEVEGGRD